MSALSFLVLCAVFVLLVILYLVLLRINSWRLSDASRRASITRWLQQKAQSPLSSDRAMELLNKHLEKCLGTRMITTTDDLGLESIVLEELKLQVDQLYHVISVSNDDDDRLVAQVAVSFHNTNTEWRMTTTKYGNVSCNVFFHCYDTRVTMEFNKVTGSTVSFSVHQLEPVNVDLSVTVTSPAMKDSVNVGNQVAMVIKDYLSCVNWSNESVVAKATLRWESFTPKELIAKETFFSDNYSPADVATDMAIANMDTKEVDEIQDTTWVAVGTPSPTESDNKEIPGSVVKDIPVITKDTPVIVNQSQPADKTEPLPSFLLSSHDTLSVNASLEASTNNGDLDNGDHLGNNDRHPKNITLNDKSHQHDIITMETPNSDVAGHIGSYSVPVTPIKPYQPSVKISGHHPHRPLFPRRSHSYEHLEELGLSPLASMPPNHSASQSGSGPFRFRGSMFASVGSTSDVQEDMSDTANNRSEVASYVSANSTSSTSQPSLLVFEFQESGITRHIAVDTTLDKIPRLRNSTKLHIWNDHVFVASHLKSTVACHVCNKKIHRILGKRNAYVCRDCKMCTHKSCHGSVKDPCPNSSYHQMTINYAESSN